MTSSDEYDSTSGAESFSTGGLDAAIEKAWEIVSSILDNAEADQIRRFRRRARMVRIDRETMDTIEDWAADVLIPADEFEADGDGDWEDEPVDEVRPPSPEE